MSKLLLLDPTLALHTACQMKRQTFSCNSYPLFHKLLRWIDASPGFTAFSYKGEQLFFWFPVFLPKYGTHPKLDQGSGLYSFLKVTVESKFVSWKLTFDRNFSKHFVFCRWSRSFYGFRSLKFDNYHYFKSMTF